MWTVPSDLTSSEEYQIKIIDSSNPDTYTFSDNFEIKEYDEGGLEQVIFLLIIGGTSCRMSM